MGKGNICRYANGTHKRRKEKTRGTKQELITNDTRVCRTGGGI
jgi:hypothetical protein